MAKRPRDVCHTPIAAESLLSGCMPSIDATVDSRSTYMQAYSSCAAGFVKRLCHIGPDCSSTNERKLQLTILVAGPIM